MKTVVVAIVISSFIFYQLHFTVDQIQIIHNSLQRLSRTNKSIFCKEKQFICH